MGVIVTGVADCVTLEVTSEVVEGREFSSAAVGGIVGVGETTTVVRTVIVDVIGSVDKATAEDVRVLDSCTGVTVLLVGARDIGGITDVGAIACNVLSATMLSGDDITWRSGVGVGRR
jgi:hypothetical protein